MGLMEQKAAMSVILSLSNLSIDLICSYAERGTTSNTMRDTLVEIKVKRILLQIEFFTKCPVRTRGWRNGNPEPRVGGGGVWPQAEKKKPTWAEIRPSAAVRAIQLLFLLFRSSLTSFEAPS
jgi:hypothetical protein